MRYVLIILLFFPFIAFAKPDTLFVDEGFNEVPKEQAAYMRVITEWGDRVKLEDYDMKGQLRSSYLRDAEMMFSVGEFGKYYENGALKVKGSYDKGKPDGEWLWYFEDKQLWASQNFGGGRLHGKTRSYYPDGKIKREAEYKNGELVRGTKYDSQGKEIPYTDFFTFPMPRFQVSTFLSDRIKYPNKARRRNVQGRVVIDFMVDEQGRLHHFKIGRSVHPLLDEEAMRVVKMMPDWIPGKEDDKPAEVNFSLPILFRLED